MVVVSQDRQHINKILFLELSSDDLLVNEAKTQAGLQNISDFDITDFNYNIGTVTKTVTDKLHNVNFIGKSVHSTI